MIQIKMREDKWRVAIINEEWEFNNKNLAMDCIRMLMDYKHTFGRLKKND